MTAWLITQFVGTDDESTSQTDDEGVEVFALSIIREADTLPDGSAFIIRKADYLKVKPRERHLRLV